MREVLEYKEVWPGGARRGATPAIPPTSHLTVTIPGAPLPLRYERTEAGHLILHGEEWGKPLTIELVPGPGARLLTSRGFHPVSEYPFNR
ncbi:hypothetical protein [Deinococcus aerius]|uniref:hypothetical protein n=1 Tax=Deinococcus aerius TaxID=200253 RepID=UPI000CCBDD37|nr:hypothetical protein [Deinococcus aerius]